MDMALESGAVQNFGIGAQSSVQGKLDLSPLKDQKQSKKFRSCPRSACPMTHPICFAGITKKYVFILLIPNTFVMVHHWPA